MNSMDMQAKFGSVLVARDRITAAAVAASACLYDIDMHMWQRSEVLCNMML